METIWNYAFFGVVAIVVYSSLKKAKRRSDMQNFDNNCGGGCGSCKVSDCESKKEEE